MPTADDERILTYIWQSGRQGENPSAMLVLALDETGQAQLACSRRGADDALALWSHYLTASDEQADAILLALAAALPWARPIAGTSPAESAREWCQLELPTGRLHLAADYPAGLALCHAMSVLIPPSAWQALGLPPD